MEERIRHTTIVLTHNTALRGIRYTRCRYAHLPWRPLDAREQQRVLSTCIANESAIDRHALTRMGFCSPSEPIDLFAAGKSGRRTRRDVRCHEIPRDLPAGSILEVGRDIYCVSPQFLLLQVAARRPLATVLALAMECCGRFSMPETHGLKSQHLLPSPEERTKYQEAEPALSAPALRNFLKHIERLHGAKPLRQLAPYVLDGARSPMEAIMALVFHLPRSYGGFGIADMKLNHRIDFSPHAQAASRMPYAVCDAYVRSARLTLEYNGGDHDEPSRRIHDELRDLGLEIMGITTFKINHEQLRDINALEIIAQKVYQRAGKRYRNRVKAYRVKQVQLLNGLRQAFGLSPC